MWGVWKQRHSDDGPGTLFHHSWRSLSDKHALILVGKFGFKPGCLKPLENQKIADLKTELQSRGLNTNGLLKPQLSAHLTDTFMVCNVSQHFLP